MKKTKYLCILTFLCLGLMLFGCSDEEELIINSDRPEIAVEETGDGEELAVSKDAGEAEDSGDAGEAGDARVTERNIFVYVIGAVNKPGVYDFPENTRIFTVVERAGGFAPEAAVESVNLAGFVEDGSVLRVMNRDEYARYSGGEETRSGSVFVPGESSLSVPGEGSGDKSSGKVNINTATVPELTELNGIGENRARAIVSYREENGRFNSPEDIKNVSGIKEGLYNKIKDRIVV